MKKRSVTLFGSARSSAPLVILNTLGNEGKAVYERVRSMTDVDITMAAIGNINWNAELSPWESVSVRKDDPPFAGGANAYIDELTGSVIPGIIDDLGDKPSYIAIAGYSLAGLFSLYTLYKTDVFTRAVSASGSFWFPGFSDFAVANDMKVIPDRLYFSLGDKEARTANKVMSTVRDNTEKLYVHFKSMGIECRYDLNSGNHFADTVERTAKGIAYAVS